MVVGHKSVYASWLLAAAMIFVTLTGGCRSRGRFEKPDYNLETASEPQQYSATVICTFQDGITSETTISREARSGEKRRQEWQEGGQNRALIWRPDLGRSFLLDLDRRTYSETDIATSSLSASTGGDKSREAYSAENPEGLTEDMLVQAIDRELGDATPPTRVEYRALPDALIEGHRCATYNERAIFPDGHVETTTKYHARDLFGLVLKSERGTEQGSAKLTIERQDIRTEVPLDTFVIPAGFKKVQNLSR